MPPSVSVAIPTFNRRATIERAVRSVLEQTHADLELVVSDDGSTDGTADLLASLAADDTRMRVVRQPRNVGMVANIDAAGRLAEGDHVMLLADDDWLAPDCVERTLSTLQADPALSAAVGQVAYVDGNETIAGGLVEIAAADAGRRVHDYLAAVDGDRGNTWLYALVRRDRRMRLSPMRNVLGFDWLHVAELAFTGPIAVVDRTLVFRELGGVSTTTSRNVEVSGLPALHAKLPHFAIARELMADIGWRSPVYSPLGRGGRLALAARCAAGVPLRNLRHVAFHAAPWGLQRRWQAR